MFEEKHKQNWCKQNKKQNQQMDDDNNGEKKCIIDHVTNRNSLEE